MPRSCSNCSNVLMVWRVAQQVRQWLQTNPGTSPVAGQGDEPDVCNQRRRSQPRIPAVSLASSDWPIRRCRPQAARPMAPAHTDQEQRRLIAPPKAGRAFVTGSVEGVRRASDCRHEHHRAPGAQASFSAEIQAETPRSSNMQHRQLKGPGRWATISNSTKSRLALDRPDRLATSAP